MTLYLLNLPSEVIYLKYPKEMREKGTTVVDHYSQGFAAHLSNSTGVTGVVLVACMMAFLQVPFPLQTPQ